jgi:hypothetical protein
VQCVTYCDAAGLKEVELVFLKTPSLDTWQLKLVLFAVFRSFCTLIVPSVVKSVHYMGLKLDDGNSQNLGMCLFKGTQE